MQITMSLHERIDAALKRLSDNHMPFRIPPEQDDVDMVLVACRDEINRLQGNAALTAIGEATAKLTGHRKTPARVSINTLALIAGRWQAEADSGAGTPDRRATLRECADLLRMLSDLKFEAHENDPAV